jgi:hypothetical protein
MSDKKQSSVGWLVEKIQQANPSFKFDGLVRQAKAMHKEEVENAYWEGGQDVPMSGKQCTQYYNETFKSE